MNILLNYIWAFMIFFSILCAAVTGRMPELSAAVISGAGNAVTLIIGMTGMMCAWTGLLKIADAGGVTAAIAKILGPAVHRLFPSCKKDGPAIKAMCMNITANLLGLGNAATPLGLAAMKELKKRNPTETADNDMVMFVVINASSIQLIPTFTATLRAQAGSATPFDILPAVWVTSFCALLIGVTAAKLMEVRPHG
jgi:spore maturation protein A